MSNPFLISSLRGTVFVPRIPYESGLINDLLQRFQGFVPITYGAPSITNGIVLNPGDWEIKSPDGTVRLIFQAQKIDYIEVSQKEYSVEKISEFAQKCSSLFCDLVSRFGQVSSRLALAPSFISQNTASHCRELLNNGVFKKEKLAFEGAELDNCDFSQVFRPKFDILGSKVSLNFLSKFSSETKISVNDGIETPIQQIKATFDINTTPVPDLNFTIEAIKDFFDNSASFCDKFYKFYFLFK